MKRIAAPWSEVSYIVLVGAPSVSGDLPDLEVELRTEEADLV